MRLVGDSSDAICSSVQRVKVLGEDIALMYVVIGWFPELVDSEKLRSFIGVTDLT
jgi:hypothetical protein